MRKAKVTITFNVCDDFEAGLCPQCPYQTRTYWENHADIQEVVKCRIGYTPITCPVIVLDEKEGEAEC